MILLSDEILDWLESPYYPVEVSVTDAYAFETPSNHHISLLEMPGELRYVTANANHPDRFREYTYVVEVYSKSARVDGAIIGSKKLCMEIISMADDVMSNHFGLNLIGNISPAPYDDPAFFRAVARYSGIIDTHLKVIYRS